MCRPATCHVCGKTTWAGCGRHIAAVKAQVPPEQWCDGTHTAAERGAVAPRAVAPRAGFLSRLLGR